MESSSSIQRRKETLKRLNSLSSHSKLDSSASSFSPSFSALNLNSPLEASISSVRHNNVVIAEHITIRRSGILKKEESKEYSDLKAESAGRSHFLHQKRRPLVNLSTDEVMMDSERSSSSKAIMSDVNPAKRFLERTNLKEEKESEVKTNIMPISSHSAKKSVFLSSPLNPKGVSLSLSSRSILCAAMNSSQDEVAFGSADHSVYSITQKKKMNLRESYKTPTSTGNFEVLQMYSKRLGHSDWVTSVAFTTHNQILSAGP